MTAGVGGDSTDTPPYAIEKEVDDIAALVDELGGNVALYGHSSGAILALLAAEKLGKQVTGLVLYEVPYNDDPEAQKAFEVYKAELTRALDNDKWGDAVTLFVKLVGVSDKQVEAMKRLPMWKGLTAMAPTLAYDTIKLMEQFPKIDAHRLETPALILYGGDSPAAMGVTAQKLAQTMPHATLRTLEGQTHDVKAAVLAPVIAEFLS